MKRYLFIFLCTSFIANGQINTAKPWAYWWWMGSAVTEDGLRENLRTYAKAGFGGLHIIPIYGVQGNEANDIPFMSEGWLKMLEFTIAEAEKNQLGIDLTLGTGWPFGGENVAPEDAAKAFELQKVGEKFEILVKNTNQKVKRAAPGGEGLVLDHFNKAATERYLQPFGKAFTDKKYGLRALYNDSYEVYGANWTSDFLVQFKARRGYDLTNHISVLDQKEAKNVAEQRILMDYHQTLSDLVLYDFTKTWVGFTHEMGKIARNEGHGSPANLLDVYAASDIPESEFFGSKAYAIPLYRQDPDYETNRFGYPGTLVMKLAGSAANISGKKLVSSETATWLGNHFKVSLAQIKPIIDESFTAGVNHVFYHGLTYSPPQEPFPGWLFYASTNFNQNSHFWKQLPNLNAYIERCQSRLQTSKPDNDILLYFPMYEIWKTPGTKSKTHAIDVHTITQGMFKSSFGDLTKSLISNGLTFDFVSDLQLQNAKVIDGKIETVAGVSYQMLVLPPCEFFDLKTLEKLDEFKKKGLKIIFQGKLPRLVTGYADFEKKQLIFDEIIARFQANSSENPIVAIQKSGVRQEHLEGLDFIRKKTNFGTQYFISNLSNTFQARTIKLAVAGKSVSLFNPLTQKTGFVSVKKTNKNEIEIPILLQSGESIFVDVFDQKQDESKSYLFDNEEFSVELKANWQIDFLKGEPVLPASYSIDSLQTWTAAKDSMAKYFSGTARYKTSFEVEDALIGKAAVLNLGDVRETAEVFLNGDFLGNTWCLPFKISIPVKKLQAKNELVINVVNLSINRVILLDKQGVKWQKFKDINIVDINYKPFNAANWKPVLSGLLGPVSLSF